MNNNLDKPVAYIRRKRKPEAIIYLKDNDQKATQKLLCYMYAADYNVDVLGETTNIEEVKNCNLMIIASGSILTRDAKEYCKIEKKMRKKGIGIQVATANGRAGKYMDMMLKLSKHI